jgi:hypothetical protein
MGENVKFASPGQNLPETRNKITKLPNVDKRKGIQPNMKVWLPVAETNTRYNKCRLQG